MKVSLNWLKELVDYKLTPQKLADELSLKSIGVKEVSDNFLELDLTYNRGDLLSLRGIARELLAITGATAKFKDPAKLGSNLPKTKVKIEDETLSEVQCSAKIEGLRVGPSPNAWVKKLADSGMRSVNNIVDVTNLIMIEFGHPLHAFDARAVIEETIIVRAARPGEKLKTLDNKTRELNPSDIVLADTQKALDVGGVMGSKDTEVKDSTQTILLSASLFNPVMVRQTSKRLGLYSEASKRFQHGLTKTNLLNAYFAAIKMYEDLGGKLVALNLVGDFEEKPVIINLNHERLNKLIGVAIPRGLVEKHLQSLGFNLKGYRTNSWNVTTPYFRLDIQIEEDLIEEVARMYGYEKIDGVPLDKNNPDPLDQSIPNFIHDLRVSLKDSGLTEVQTYSFYSSKVIDDLRLKIKDLVKIANPISSETQYLRSNIWPNLVEVVGKNLKNGFSDIAIFEIGKAYGAGENGLPFENYHISIALMNGGDNPMQELMSIIRGVKLAHLQGVQHVQSKGGEVFHPTRFINIEKDGKEIGAIAEVHPRILNEFGFEKRVAVLEIDLSNLISS